MIKVTSTKPVDNGIPYSAIVGPTVDTEKLHPPISVHRKRVAQHKPH